MTTDTSATTTSVDEIAQNADGAFRALSRISPAVRARAIVAAADALEANADALVPIGMAETGLAEGRLRGELKRTAVQLRVFADTVVDGSYLDARIDAADPNFALGPRPDVRRYLTPVGPVINFAASNFPFAFSVAGGDTAAALASGCSLVVKTHSGHPELSAETARVITEALTGAGLPEHVFQTISGQQRGVDLLKHPLIAAGSFTGSTKIGRMLADIAAARPKPIPFYGELGSVNPVFVTEQAISERAAEIASGLVTSVGGSAGQLCTKPGFVFVPDAAPLEQGIAEAASEAQPHRMLNPRIADGYGERRDAILSTDGVRAIAVGSLERDVDGQGWATPTIVVTDAATLVAQRDRLLDESFGPLSVVVQYSASDDLAALAEELFPGNLTATVHHGDGEASDALRELVAVLSEGAGRVLFNGWPTGVAVTPAMQHGGPWPATTNDSNTSVGTAAITRFVRPVAYQNAPQSLLPEALQDANPWNVPQRFAPAGESVNWGDAARG
ncbi:aldehyde dehydrogenase (NADP(+)) [Paramicrobacterium chengjingii]|uniref:Aldehyde dehydrogenase (NADP(+)) n=1 Tax=Paramicrobacterium chengjingii TaxID=2769067 RepID=A0ABX6YGY0_9MICO|nr:aldehyde dehydrogenase (NADP(+)) [Microbacterium chengjingii]QPZ38053.1 aldehyde dehydrogenase (NADP(+)) [Microbacterium chengjingii]